MIGKKGNMSTVQMLLLFLAVTIVLTLFFIPFISWAGETSDKEACRLSVAAKYGGKAATLSTSESSINLQCFTQELTINNEGVYKKGKDRKERQVESFPSYSGAGGKSKLDITYERQELVKEAIANEMYDCWDQFWQGKLSIFTSGKRCVICSDITFDSDWIDTEGTGEQGENARFVNLGQYLKDTKINKEQTYSDFLGQGLGENFGLNTKVVNKIVFKAVAYSWWEKSKDATEGLCTGYAIGAGIATVAGGPFAPITGGFAAVTAGTMCFLTAITAPGFSALFAGSDWVPTMVVGPSAVVAEDCDKLY